jgi:hypothetical protein
MASHINVLLSSKPHSSSKRSQAISIRRQYVLRRTADGGMRLVLGFLPTRKGGKLYFGTGCQRGFGVRYGTQMRV